MKRRYTCHSENLDTAPRDTVHIAPTHTKEGVSHKIIVTRWQNIECGHITSFNDKQCNGCKNKLAKQS